MASRVRTCSGGGSDDLRLIVVVHGSARQPEWHRGSRGQGCCAALAFNLALGGFRGKLDRRCR